MKKIILIWIFILYDLAHVNAQTFPVYIAFSGFSGQYYIDEYKPTFIGKDTLLQLTSGQHYLKINGYPFAWIAFIIDSIGNVTTIDKKQSAYEKDTTMLIGKIRQKMPRIVLKTSIITIDPHGAIYCFSPYIEPYPHYQTSTKPRQFIVVNDLSYFIATQFSGNSFCINKNKVNDSIPELFFVNVDSIGFVHPGNLSVVSKISANYYKKTISLNSVQVTLDPLNFYTDKIKVGGYSYLAKKTYQFIRGLGLTVTYKSNGIDKYFYFVPM